MVTGAAGFIGSHLTRRLRADGHRVVGVDAYRGCTTEQRAERLGDLTGDPGFDLVELDLAAAALEPVLHGARAVFHLAARPGARDRDRAALTRDNVDATAAVLAAAEAAGVPELVYASSSSVYGDGASVRPCREDDPLRPISFYGESKLLGERLCTAARLRSTSVRFFTVYGPHQRPDMAFERFLYAARMGDVAPLYQDPRAIRDYTYVTDAVEGMLLAWRHGVAPVYNVSGGQAVPLARVCRLIEELTGVTLSTSPVDAPPQPSATQADLTLARTHLGYAPSVGLREGLRLQLAHAAAPIRSS